LYNDAYKSNGLNHYYIELLLYPLRTENIVKTEEGKINVDGYQVWYRCVGDGGIPLLTLHGGPGAGHDYLESLERLATDRSVIFYDQLGCGKSDQPNDRSLWKI
jgi:hypothetical protein